MSDSISVEVAYALPDKQRIVKLDVTPGTIALEAATLSKLDELSDELVVGSDLNIGVRGQSINRGSRIGCGEASGDLKAVTGRPQRGAQSACGQSQGCPS